MPDKENNENLACNLEASQKINELELEDSKVFDDGGVATAPLLQVNKVNGDDESIGLDSKERDLESNVSLSSENTLRLDKEYKDLESRDLESSISDSTILDSVSLDSNDLDSKAKALFLEENLNAHKSLENDLNLQGISLALQQRLNTQDTMHLNHIHTPYIDFSSNNHTLKQIRPSLKQPSSNENIAHSNDKDSIQAQDYNNLNIANNIPSKKENPSQTKSSTKPAIYTLDDTPHDTAEKKDTKKHKKKAKKKGNPLLRLIIFFVVILSVTIIGYKILANGISFQNLKFGNITIYNAFLQLQNKLILEIDSIDLSTLSNNESKDNTQETRPFNEILQNTIQYTQRTLYILSYFERLNIKELVLPNNHKWSIDYTDTNYRIQGALFDADFAINNNHNNIHLDINKFQLKTLPLHFEGNLNFSVPKKQLSFNLEAIKDDDNEKIMLSGDTNFNEININAKSSPLNNLAIIKPFIDNIQNPKLKKTLQDWLFNNIKYDNLHLSNLAMRINLDDIGNTLLHNTQAEIIVEKPEVTLAKGVKPILAEQAVITFKDTDLKITPINATFAGMNLAQSEVLIANMPHSDVIIELHGKNVRFDSNLAKLLEHYGVVLPIMQQSLAQNTKKSKQTKIKTESKNTKKTLDSAINTTEDAVTKALQTKQTLNTEQTTQTNTNEKQAQIATNENLYEKILELNPQTTLTNELLHNPNLTKSSTKETTSMHLQIAIRHNKKIPTHPLFSLQGIIQAQNTSLKLYDIPLQANNLNIALDITPQQKLVYINGERVKWQRLIDANVNVLLDINKQNIQANTYIHKAILNTHNLQDLRLAPNKPTIHLPSPNNENLKVNNNDSKIALHVKNLYDIKKQKKINRPTPQEDPKDSIQNNIAQHSGIYLEESMPYSNTQKILKYFDEYSIQRTNMQTPNNSISSDSHKLLEDARKQQLQNKELSPEVIKSLPKQNIKDDGERAKEDDKVLKDLKNNPVWNDLKIRSKKTQPFKQLSTKELTELAKQAIEKEKDSFMLDQDFLNIKNANIHLNLSFANNKIVLDVPALSLHLESGKNLQLSIAKIENILQFSPLAQYYGITHGDFSLQTTPYPKTKQESFKSIDFTLNLTKLKHPLYTIKHERVTDLNLKGHLQDNSIVVLVNDDIDFKSQDSLSMLRMKGYRIDIDEAMQSKIPFFIDLFKDKQKDALPYSEAAILQELKFIAIKNKLRKQMNIKPTDFNIIGQDLQFSFLGYTAPFDSVNIRFIDNRIVVDGQYGKGILNASLIKDNVYVKAKNFSGDFINIILASAKGGKKMLNGGAFSLDGIYRGGILNASIELQNTALIDFKSVQNIFALIDTVPSLFMFKDPHISAKGYQVNYGKVIFAINSDYVGLQNVFLLGSSMDINGQGIIDIDTQEMNVNLNISTIKNLSKFINKIPIIGYLILGREGQISTNLILSGKYSDPKVNITLAADIIKAPFNILRRVFPVEMLVNSSKDEEEMILY